MDGYIVFREDYLRSCFDLWFSNLGLSIFFFFFFFFFLLILRCGFSRVQRNFEREKYVTAPQGYTYIYIIY